MSRATILLAFIAAWVLPDIHPVKLQTPLTFLAILFLTQVESWLTRSPIQQQEGE